jgi:hypothetical protein
LNLFSAAQLDTLVWSDNNHKIMLAGIIASVWSGSDPNFKVGWKHILRTQRGFDCARRHVKEVMSCTRIWTNDVQALVDTCLDVILTLGPKMSFVKKLLNTVGGCQETLASILGFHGHAWPYMAPG